MDCVVGVDLGGTNMRAAVVDATRAVVAREERPTLAKRGVDAVINALVESIETAVQMSGLAMDALRAVCIGVPGPLNWQSGIVYSPPNLPGWKDVPLAQIVGDRLDVPCFIENDANVACYGEFWKGAGQGVDNMAMLTLGTGVGGGVVVFERLLRGPDGTAGELGHLKVQRHGRPCGCGGTGCLEQYASVSGMLQTAREALENDTTSQMLEMCEGDRELLTGKMVFDAATAGDPVALWVFDETAHWLALGIASIIHYQNPERVILYGGMVAAGDMLMEPLRRYVVENTFEVPGRRCQILAARLGADAGILGAAGIAFERLENPDAAR